MEQNFKNKVDKLIDAVEHINEVLTEQGIYIDEGYCVHLEVIPFHERIIVRFLNAFIWTSDEDWPLNNDIERALREIIMRDIVSIKQIEL